MFRKMIAPLAALGLVAAVSAAPQQNPPAQTPPAGAQGSGAGGRGAGGAQGAPGAPQNLTVWVPHTITPEKIDEDMNAKIKTEGMDHSKIMWIEHNLADVYGPRPIGSPNHKAAADWAVKTMTSWGMKNAHLEPFTWRGVGWLPGRASGRAVVAVDQRHRQRRSRQHRRARESYRRGAEYVSDQPRATREKRHRHGGPRPGRGGEFQRGAEAYSG
jgi:hypothetical protein